MNGKHLEDALQFVYYVVCISKIKMIAPRKKALNEATNYEDTI